MKITDQQALQRIIDHREIFYDEMIELMKRLMNGEMSPVIVSAFIMGLRVKKETVGEISAAATVMRELSTKVQVRDAEFLVDVVGTGGDNASTFNISTAACFVAAACGVKIAKHGGRSVSSSSGSSDVIEKLGAKLLNDPVDIAQCIDKVGLGFMFAPNHHSAMKYAAPIRKELGIRTLFNILGPLTNPANAKRQVLGVFHPDLVGILLRVLQRLGATHCMVVHGLDGIDEISLTAPTLVGELLNGEVREYELNAHMLGLNGTPLINLRVKNAEESAQMLRSALSGENPAARDLVVINAAATLLVGELASDIPQAIEKCQQAIQSGAALTKLDEYIRLTQLLGNT